MNQIPDRSQFAIDDAMLTPPKLQPLRALRAFAKLVEDKEDTAQVFEIIQALSGTSLSKNYNRMLRTPKGGVQAYAHIELAPYFDDETWLAQFGEGTVGAAYRAFRAERDLTVEGLAMEAAKVNEGVEAPHPIAWMARRLRDTHDLWHTLTGYGTDALGEACLLGFTHGQVPNGGVAFIATGAANEFRKIRQPYPYVRAIWEGYRLGKKAERLIDEDYLKLLAEPLEAARQRLRLTAPQTYLSIPAEYRNRFGDEAQAA
ncbi:MAG TPA: Coq4 family protein [Caulobacteraceae bacterium]|nr:Coq4 family protein [Caulobacteraceae bacterium]